MRVSFIRDGTGEIVDITSFIRDYSLVWDQQHSIDSLVDAIGEARYVLLGEASHGTHEYYAWRAKLSRELIRRKGFSFIGVEGDWPDCYRINRYIKNYKDAGSDAKSVLGQFNRWPTWMWANWEIVAMAEWLKEHNASFSPGKRVGFYGLDVYSLWDSLKTVIEYLDKVDPITRETAEKALLCFESYGSDEGQSYARATMNEWMPASCETEVVNLLVEVRTKMEQYNSDPEAMLNTEQNAMVAVNAEKYYRAMVKGGPASWNIRDHHMHDTLNRLMQFHGEAAKAIVWEHNTHIGDARATDMRMEGMINVGQLVNESQPPGSVFSVGFGSYKGSVIAGRRWGDVMRQMQVPAAQADSWEYILHQADAKDRLILMDGNWKNLFSSKEFGHRAIGVVYNPEWEFGNYVPSIMPLRYDAFVFFDTTKALFPLHIKPHGHEMPETYPFGM